MQVPVSPEVNELLDDAVALSVRRSQYYVGVEHVFEALIAKSNLLPKAVTSRYLDALHAAAREVASDVWRGSIPSAAQEVFYTPRTAAITAAAARLAERQGDGRPAAGHLLLALLADAHAAPSRAMDRLNLPRGDVIQALRKALSARAEGSPPATEASASDSRRRTAVSTSTAATSRAEGVRGADGDASTQSRPMELKSLTRDLTELARRGVLESAIGRDDEVLQILEVLARKNKNNVILLGESGVGKTRVVEGLAAMLLRKNAEGFLDGRRILELNLAALMAGTQYRGAFEERILPLLEELKRDTKVILFIDEIHLIMGAGATEGSGMDLSNLLKPALARGEIRCIGATTIEEYRKFIEKDPALERRFQPVRIEELSPRATLEVLKRLRPALEGHHGVHISGKALHAAVMLTQRYMPNRRFPDKAIDVLDQACARYRLKLATRQSGSQVGAPAAPAPEGKVTPHDVRNVISRATSIPIEEMTADERKRLDGLDHYLKRRLIGQDEAVARAVAAVKKSRAGLADPNRPDAVMLFLGPTGVGKTQLANALAESIFGSSNHLFTFDMSEYIEEHSVSRLLGAPPGYVGSEREGRLTGAVRSTPFSILLFDEIEKAHPRIFDIFLPILDHGRLKDSLGREVSFRNCIIIFTSNLGADVVRASADNSRAGAPSKTGRHTDRGELVDALRRHFRPEFINRIDEIVPFYPLLFEDVRAILKLCFRDVAKRLREKDMSLRVYQGAYEHLAQKGYSPEFGVRELQRTVDQLVIGPVSSMFLEGQFQSGDVVEVLMEEGGLTFRRGLKPHVSSRSQSL